ncbi:uncharacterized protein LOC127243890 isoform X2 [Andrographis paniculata]|uniref:uncharacterized protein LOC127243890 isoform X2 n=1 Tax=Andrographis paniculata TaxID=175694 RepID=UPI0021E7D002|nr:uncharacterized protein LOC127243890 isoform X2 [Andrographis paniculata]
MVLRVIGVVILPPDGFLTKSKALKPIQPLIHSFREQYRTEPFSRFFSRALGDSFVVAPAFSGESVRRVGSSSSPLMRAFPLVFSKFKRCNRLATKKDPKDSQRTVAELGVDRVSYSSHISWFGKTRCW